jgi:hypothetical protein
MNTDTDTFAVTLRHGLRVEALEESEDRTVGAHLRYNHIGDPNELVALIHPRMTTFVEPRDYEEYLASADRPPIHLLRILPADKMQVRLVDASPITNLQVNLFDPQ